MIKVESKGNVIFTSPVSAVIDAADAVGQGVGHKVMAMANEKAKKSGICHGFMAINPAIFGDYVPEHLQVSNPLKHLSIL